MRRRNGLPVATCRIRTRRSSRTTPRRLRCRVTLVQLLVQPEQLPTLRISGGRPGPPPPPPPPPAPETPPPPPPPPPVAVTPPAAPPPLPPVQQQHVIAEVPVVQPAPAVQTPAPSA